MTKAHSPLRAKAIACSALEPPTTCTHGDRPHSRKQRRHVVQGVALKQRDGAVGADTIHAGVEHALRRPSMLTPASSAAFATKALASHGGGIDRNQERKLLAKHAAHPDRFVEDVIYHRVARYT
jgi:hypothetical protein